MHRWTEPDPSVTMVRALNVLESVIKIAKKREDTDTLLIVAQAFAEISLRLGSDQELSGSDKVLGFVHSLKAEEEE